MTTARTIVYVGNTTKSWCTETHVSASLTAEGHTVVAAQENRVSWPDVERLVEEHRADMVLWTRTWPAELDEVVPSLERLRARGVPTVSYHLDRWFGLDREHQVRDQPFFRSQLVVSPDDSPRWAEEGVNHLWMPPGVFDAECGPVRPDRSAWPAEVVFVGSHPYPHPEWAGYRSELIRRMQEAFPTQFAVLPRSKTQPIRGKALRRLYATAKVVVGDSCLAGESHRYWSDRVPETLGRGGLLLHPTVPGGIGVGEPWYEPGVHLLGYERGDFDSAVEHVRQALDPDNEVAVQSVRDQGRKLVLSRDTYRHRLSAVLDHVGETIGWPDRPEPVAGPTHRPVRVTAGPRRQWRARFDPRPGDVDVDGGDFVVVSEVWDRNDYRVPTGGFAGTVVDVGANVGAFSVLAALAGARRVVAFEPDPGNRERLIHHLAVNKVGNVEVDERAVVGDGPSTIRVDGVGGGVHQAPTGVEVETIRLSEVLELGPVEFLKMDIEGGEFEAFRGVSPSEFGAAVGRLGLEWHGPVMPHLSHLDGDGFGPLVSFLADCGRVETFGHPKRGGLIWWEAY